MIGKPEDLVKFLFNQDRDKLFEIKEHKERRSLNANAYLWVLVNKIADLMRTTKEEVYVNELKRYGQSDLVSVKSKIDVRPYFKYFEQAGSSVLNGTEFTHYRVFKGSSEYDSREMAVLIDGVIQDAEELGIETLPPHEIERLKHLWKSGAR